MYANYVCVLLFDITDSEIKSLNSLQPARHSFARRMLNGVRYSQHSVARHKADGYSIPSNMHEQSDIFAKQRGNDIKN